MTSPTEPSPAAMARRINAVAMGDTTRLAVQYADWAVPADIRSECVQTELDGNTWWDTRPMVNPHEHTAPQIDMAYAALAYAALRGLIHPHPQLTYLVRIHGERS